MRSVSRALSRVVPLVAVSTVAAIAAIAAAAAGTAGAHGFPGNGFPGHGNPGGGPGGASQVVGHVYVNDNTAGANTIAAYDRHADGTLTAVPGSPFADRRRWHRRRPRSVRRDRCRSRPTVATCWPSTRDQPGLDAGDPARRRARAAAGRHRVLGRHRPGQRRDPRRPRLRRQRQRDRAELHRLPARTGSVAWRRSRARPSALPAGSQPGDVLFNATGSTLAGTLVASSQIVSYRVDWTGRLDAAPGSPYAAQGPGPVRLGVQPGQPRTSCSSQTPTAAPTPAAYRRSGSGFGSSLSSIGSSPFA